MIDLSRVAQNLLSLGIIAGLGYIIYKKMTGGGSAVPNKLSFLKRFGK